MDCSIYLLGQDGLDEVRVVQLLPQAGFHEGPSPKASYRSEISILVSSN